MVCRITLSSTPPTSTWPARRLRRAALLLAVCANVALRHAVAHDDMLEGTATWHLNRDALAPLDLEIRLEGRERGAAREPYASVQCGLRRGAGSLELGCALALEHAGSMLTFDALQLLSDPDDATRAQWRDAAGRIWFALDHAHAAPGGLAGRHANLKPGAALMQWLDQPAADAPTIGGMDWVAPAMSQTPQSVDAACSAPWTSPATPARIRLLSMAPNYETGRPDTIAFERCTHEDASGFPTPCTNGSSDGQVVFAPDASLENVGRSAVPWHAMFSGRFAPYDNDQHPFLIWNLYREQRDGSLRQIGRSGVKHAFYAINIGCRCDAGHVVYPTCRDTYSSFNNDSLAFLGPRAEVIPARGQWASCGSVFDRDCDGVPGPRPPGEDDGHRWRLNVSERDLAIPGARYFFEYGYLTRDQADREQAFGWREVHPAKVPGSSGFATWQLSPDTLQAGFVLGRWLRSAPRGARVESRSFATPSGGGGVGVRVVPIGAGRFRYAYAIHNSDLAVATTVSTAHGLRLEASHGIDRVELTPVAAVALSGMPPTAADVNAEWPMTRDGERVVWNAPDGEDLTWGSLLTIDFDSPSAPRRGRMRLCARACAQDSAEVETLVPGDG